MLWKLFHWHKLSRNLYKYVEEESGKRREVKMTVYAWARSWNIEEVAPAFHKEIHALKREGWMEYFCYDIY